MTVTFCELNSNSLPVQLGVGVKNYPLFLFFLFFAWCVFLFYPELFNDAVSVKSDSRCIVKQTWGLYSHSFAKKKKNTPTNTSLCDHTDSLCTSQTLIDGQINVDLLLWAAQMISVYVCLSVMLILFCILSFLDPSLWEAPSGSAALKATESSCWVNATAGLEQIKMSVFMQWKCGK